MSGSRLFLMLLLLTLSGNPSAVARSDGDNVRASTLNLSAGDRSSLRRQLNMVTGVTSMSARSAQDASTLTTVLPDEIFWYGFEVCGNGVIDNGEQCDKTDLGGATCGSLGYPGGDLSCTHQCQFDRSQCAATCSLSCTIDADCGGPACGPCVTNICFGAFGAAQEGTP
jgi:hypothetical protein